MARRQIPDDAARWILAKAREAPIQTAPGRAPRPAWSLAEIARNFNRSRTAERLGVAVSTSAVKRLVRARGGEDALRYRRRGAYPALRPREKRSS